MSSSPANYKMLTATVVLAAGSLTAGPAPIAIVRPALQAQTLAALPRPPSSAQKPAAVISANNPFSPLLG